MFGHPTSSFRGWTKNRKSVIVSLYPSMQVQNWSDEMIHSYNDKYIYIMYILCIYYVYIMYILCIYYVYIMYLHIETYFMKKTLTTSIGPRESQELEREYSTCLIISHCWWKKSCTTWDVWNPAPLFRPRHLPLPSPRRQFVCFFFHGASNIRSLEHLEISSFMQGKHSYSISYFNTYMHWKSTIKPVFKFGRFRSQRLNWGCRFGYVTVEN